MTDILNNREAIHKLDSGNMLGSLQLLSEQIKEVEANAKSLRVPANYRLIKNIVVAGMGGSALGSHIIKSVYKNYLSVPLEIVNDYTLPDFVNSSTLLIISSYSGTTEESIAAFKQGRIKKAKMLVICAGGDLEKMAKRFKVPTLIFTTKNNPCGSPRMGLGYSIFGQLWLLAKAGVITFTSSHAEKLIKIIHTYETQYGVNTEDNLVKQMARTARDRSIWYVASEHLIGNAHTAANQMNENAKRFSGYFTLPELNHHLMEGMKHPQDNANGLLFIFLESKLYGKRTQKRYAITKKVLEQNKIPYLSYLCDEKTALGQATEALVMGSYLSFYLAMLEGIDPTAIPFVDYFKSEMKK